MIIDLVVGARPNFVKAAAILHAAKQYPNVKVNLIHTGQHDGVMSDPFFEELELPTPAPHRSLHFVNGPMKPLNRLGILISFLGGVFAKDKPDYVMVVGDTDSTLAGAIAAAKLVIPVIHVEAGLRCGDMGMQEEINRIMVDSVSDICYTTTREARDTLIAEGHHPDSVQFVGNVMIDTLYRFLPIARAKYPRPPHRQDPYAIVTLHRAENVDRDEVLTPLLDVFEKIATKIALFFPVHPRLRQKIGNQRRDVAFLGRQPIYCTPVDYLHFIALLSDAMFVMTDSGGLQEETTALGIPCLTLRKSTERPETVWQGTNWLVGTDPESIELSALSLMTKREPITFSIPELWDGHAADRIMSDLAGGIPN